MQKNLSFFILFIYISIAKPLQIDKNNHCRFPVNTSVTSKNKNDHFFNENKHAELIEIWPNIFVKYLCGLD